MSLEAMKMALEALDIACRNYGDVGGADTHWGRWDAAMTALRQAIEQAEKREWVGLTDEDLKPLCDEWKIMYGGYVDEFSRAIEAKLKEKNA